MASSVNPSVSGEVNQAKVAQVSVAELSDPSHFQAWKETSPGRWERPCDGMESYFVLVANLTASLCNGREHYTLYSNIQLQAAPGVDVLSSLKQAWKQLRYEQPTLACTADGEKFTKVYDVQDEAGIEKWVSETVVVSDAPSAAEAYSDLKPIKQPTLYWLPKSSEVTFRCPHWLSDGVGLIHFWNALFGCLESPVTSFSWGSEVKRLGTTVEGAMGYGNTPTPEQVETAKAMFNSWATSIPAIGPKSRLGTAPAGKCAKTDLVLSPKMTAAIIAGCKAKGVSVTSAIHAAYLQVLQKVADPESNVNNYSSVCEFSFRNHMPAPYNGSSHALNMYYSSIPFATALPIGFDEAAQKLNTYYRTTMNQDLLALNGHYTRVLFDVINTPAFLTAPVPKDALVSSLGIAERYMRREYMGGKFSIADLHAGYDAVMGMTLFVFWTFADKLHITYFYNEGHEDKADIDAFTSEVGKVLIENVVA